MLKDLLRPTALLSHVLVLLVAVTCVALGQWQLDRLAQVRANNALLEERLQAPPVELATLVDERPVDEAGLEYRRVTARGIFRPEQEVLQRGAQHNNQQGFSVLTPLELEGGGVVLVRRGFVPSALDTPPVAEAAPPSGTVQIAGILERPVPQPDFGPQDPPGGDLARVFHTDTARLDRQVDGELYPMVVRVQTDEVVAYDALPVPPEPPVLDERNHFSYAMQWHAFALLAVVTYGAWLWKRRGRGDDPDASEKSAPPAPPARVAG
ncbi:SURF1 family protein [Egicoccus sp. AB-alg2]|uniref:SURF1 family protein n=1 Tax=Egicoccus sp. AB-alg2 TaxID=3242693 RepID=UPI00359D9F2D